MTNIASPITVRPSRPVLKTFRPALLLLLACALLARPGNSPAADPAGPAKPAKTVRLLTVGNSFSQNATRFLGKLAVASGNALIHHPAAVGGATMALHWQKAEQFEKDPQNTNGFYSSKRSLQQELRAEPWDFVTIQQASIQSHNVATYRPYASQLHAYIKKHAPQAEVLVHETWAYRCDDPRFDVKNPKPVEPATQEAMYQALASAYRTIASELGSRLIPVGDAFHMADTHPERGYKPDTAFDFKAAQPPALPNQAHSIHAGWRWQKQPSGAPKLQLDGHHAGVAGEYLGACVFFEVLYGQTAVGNPFVPAGVAPEDARFLQQTAHQAVLNTQAKPSAVAKPPGAA